ncbi:D-inositol-3-phosphate glycosyltransferase [Agrococcus sp. UYP10]|uniref:glycosyltransferase family 4 protein n=1 Tax=Agrococcus sp. UYP10 TaxID=1756355 RepID=UPI0033993E75
MDDPLAGLWLDFERFALSPSDDPGFGARLSSRHLGHLTRSLIQASLAERADLSRRAGAPDLLARVGENGRPVGVEMKRWSRSRKSLANHVSAALSDAVRARRAVPTEIVLVLFAVVLPSTAEDSLPTADLFRTAAQLQRHADGAGFDAIYVGLVEPEPRWFRVADRPVQLSYDEVLAEYAIELHSQVEAPQLEEGPVVALLVADEWGSALGGVSTFNRELASGLQANGFAVHMLLPEASPEDVAEASRSGVVVHSPSRVPGVTGASALLSPAVYPASFAPDVIVGHGRVLGPYAFAVQKGQFPNARRWHIVHTDSESIEAVRSWADDAAHMHKADQRRLLENELASSAELVSGVGPVLTASIQRNLRGYIPAPTTFEVVPPPRDWGAVATATAVDSDFEVLILARAEDFELKGIDIAARAMELVAHALAKQTPRRRALLAVRGVSGRDESDVRRRLQELAPTPSLFVRPYSIVPGELRTDIFAATVALLPSRHEGFGLSALEAIGAGVPVLVSAESGVGRLILRQDPSAPEVLEVSPQPGRDIDSWAEAILQVANDPEAAFRRAAQLRDILNAEYSWAQIATDLCNRLR